MGKAIMVQVMMREVRDQTAAMISTLTTWNEQSRENLVDLRVATHSALHKTLRREVPPSQPRVARAVAEAAEEPEAPAPAVVPLPHAARAFVVAVDRGDVTPHFNTLRRHLEDDPLRPHGDERVPVGEALHAADVCAVCMFVVRVRLARRQPIKIDFARISLSQNDPNCNSKFMG